MPVLPFITATPAAEQAVAQSAEAIRHGVSTKAINSINTTITAAGNAH